MTTADYITTTGERWHEGAPFNEGWIPTLLRDEAENDEDCTIVRPPEILAELRALRAQRDELLAALKQSQGAIMCFLAGLGADEISESFQDLDEADTVARAAIARAKGEA